LSGSTTQGSRSCRRPGRRYGSSIGKSSRALRPCAPLFLARFSSARVRCSGMPSDSNEETAWRTGCRSWSGLLVCSRRSAASEATCSRRAKRGATSVETCSSGARSIGTPDRRAEDRGGSIVLVLTALASGSAWAADTTPTEPARDAEAVAPAAATPPATRARGKQRWRPFGHIGPHHGFAGSDAQQRSQMSSAAGQWTSPSDCSPGDYFAVGLEASWFVFDGTGSNSDSSFSLYSGGVFVGLSRRRHHRRWRLQARRQRRAHVDRRIPELGRHDLLRGGCSQQPTASPWTSAEGATQKRRRLRLREGRPAVGGRVADRLSRSIRRRLTRSLRSTSSNLLPADAGGGRYALPPSPVRTISSTSDAASSSSVAPCTLSSTSSNFIAFAANPVDVLRQAQALRRRTRWSFIARTSLQAVPWNPPLIPHPRFSSSSSFRCARQSPEAIT